MPDLSALTSHLAARSGELHALACAVLWSVAVIFFRRSGEIVEPLVLNLFKGVVGLGAFLVTLLVLGLPLVPEGIRATDVVVLFLSGMVGIGVADTLFFAGLNRIGAGLTAIVDCLYAPLVMLCSYFWLREPTSPWLLLSLALMVAAILVGSFSPSELRNIQDPRLARQGVLLGAAAVLLMAVAIVAAKPVLDRTNPWWAATVRLSGGVLLLGLQAALTGRSAAVIRAFRPGRHWRLLLPGAIIGAWLAMFFWIAGMKYTQTNTASILNQSSSVITLLLAAPFLGERLTGRRIVALLLGFGGVLLVL